METIQSCPECNGTQLIHEWERGEVTCTTCGIVVGLTYDNSGNITMISTQGDPQTGHVGTPLTPIKPDFGFQTKIGGTNRDASGTPLKPEKKLQMQRLQELDSRSRRSEIRNLRVALRELKRVCSQLGLPRPVIESAAIYYRKALKKGLVRGRSIEGIVASAVYLAARNHNTTVTIRDMIQTVRIDQKELGRFVRVLLDELKVKPNQIDPKVLVHRLATTLDVSMITQRRALQLIEKTKQKNGTLGKNPVSIAAAAFYIACIQTGERRTQRQIAKASKTTPVTIRNRFKELEKLLNLDLKIKRGAAAIPVYWTKNRQG
jgi:transcription initiation factor TFIIB